MDTILQQELHQSTKIVINGTVGSGGASTTLIGNRNGDRIFVDIHTNKFYTVHDLPPWLWLCIERVNVWLSITHVCKEGRSFRVGILR